MDTKQMLEKAIRFFLFIFILFIPMKTSIYPISFGILVLLFGIYIFKNKQFSTFITIIKANKKVIVAFVLVISCMTLSNILSPYSTYDSWRIIFHYIFRYFLFFLILLFFYKKAVISKHFIILAVFSSLLLQAVDGIFQAIYQYDFIRHKVGSLYAYGLSGATFNRNTFGLFMAIGASLAIVFLIKKEYNNFSNYKKGLLYFSTILFIFGLLFSYSRSAWIFFNVFSILFFSLEYKSLSYKDFIISLMCIFFIVFSFYYFDTLYTRLLQLIHLNSSNRVTVWLDSLHLIKERPFFGYGLMTYAKIASQKIFSVHNSFLEITLFLGLFGLITFTFLLYVIFQKILQIKNSIYISFFLSFLTITQFDHSIIKSIPMLSTLSLFAFFIYSETKGVKELPNEIS
jgi:O-antigen ligase